MVCKIGNFAFWKGANQRFAFLVVFLLSLLAPLGVSATDLEFTWNSNVESDMAGYRVYEAATPGNYTFGLGQEVLGVAHIGGGAESGRLTDVGDGTYYFVVTAFDNSGNESGPSNEVMILVDTLSPVMPEGLKVSVVITME